MDKFYIYQYMHTNLKVFDSISNKILTVVPSTVNNFKSDIIQIESVLKDQRFKLMLKPINKRHYQVLHKVLSLQDYKELLDSQFDIFDLISKGIAVNYYNLIKED